MERYRQYKMLKKVEKFLKTPTPEEEVYSANPQNTYIGTRSRSTPPSGAHVISTAHPDQGLRLSQARQLAELLLEMMDTIERMKTVAGEREATLNSKLPVLVADIEIRFEELRMDLLFTDAEKESKTQAKLASCATHSVSVQFIPSSDLETSRLRIQEFQTAVKQRKRSVWKVEQTIRDLGVNVNDSRCTKILTEQRDAEAGLKRTVDEGVKTMREEFQKIKSA